MHNTRIASIFHLKIYFSLANDVDFSWAIFHLHHQTWTKLTRFLLRNLQLLPDTFKDPFSTCIKSIPSLTSLSLSLSLFLFSPSLFALLDNSRHPGRLHLNYQLVPKTNGVYNWNDITHSANNYLCHLPTYTHPWPPLPSTNRHQLTSTTTTTSTTTDGVYMDVAMQ